MRKESSRADVFLFNTMSRTVEKLHPLTPGKVKLYCCGPTVYNFQHIGNLRTYVFEDLLARTLRYAGYEVTHVMNITDVGHLASDADEGEDKMLLASRREGKSSYDIAAYYTEVFFEHCRWLNISRPSIICKATEHISEMISLIQKLEELGAAYLSGGNVYFDVSKSPDYGKLAGLNLESLKSGARIEVDSKKRNPQDFALWFTKSKFEKQEMQWDSPWGRGYPGWHIECSAMSMKYLGDSFDIHCGGIDHIPVHHTNEIAQSETSSGRPLATLWMHGGFLVVDSAKMSKSTGEFLTLDRCKERGIDPIAYRLFCLSGSYRQELSWSWQALESAGTTLKRLQQQVLTWKEETSPARTFGEDAQKTRMAFKEECFNDLGMPKALAVLHEAVRNQRLPVSERLALLLDFDEVLGLGIDQWEVEALSLSSDIEELLASRSQARKAKDWKRSDELRDMLFQNGYVVEDSKDGQKIRKRP